MMEQRQAMHFLAALQEQVHEGATMIAARNQTREAYQLHRHIIRILLDHTAESTSVPQQQPQQMKIPQEEQQQGSRNLSFGFCPMILPDAVASTPAVATGTPSEAFLFPFTFVVHHHPRRSAGAVVYANLERVYAACGAACLFNMGLSAHLDALRRNQDNGATLQTACKLYERAWSSLHMATTARAPQDDQDEEEDDTDGSTLFLFMAICTNLATCHYHLGDMAAYNQWLGFLRELLSSQSSNCTDCTSEDQCQTFMELRRMFLTISAVNAKCIAASAA